MMVSVIVPCFNHAALLRQALDSVAEQTFGDWELVVVDDGSTDDSLDVARSFASAYPDFDVTLIRTRNRGLSRARNAGISVARGDYILPLDADDWIEPSMLEVCLEILAARPEAMAVAPRTRDYFPDDKVWNPPPWSFQLETIRNVVPYCSLYRRSAWAEVGGYAEEMAGYEDWDFWISVGALGPIVQLSEPLFRYRFSRDSLLNASQARDLELRAWIVRRHPGIYGESCVTLADRILSGEPVPAGELRGSASEIFTLSRIARNVLRSAS